MLARRHALVATSLLALLLPVTGAAQNRALGMPTFSSGVWSATLTQPSNAVDGNTNGLYGNGSTSHSSQSAGGWWYVDLGRSYDVRQIDFWNRTDCCTTRIVGATLGIFAAAPYGMGGPAPIHSWTFASGGAHQVFTPASAVAGRYVGIRAAPSGNAYLQIAEVEVYGAPTVPTSSVPEPSTYVMLASGLLALGIVARRRRTA